MDASRVGRMLGVAIAILGALFCFGSWMFGLIILGAGAALYAACLKSES
jgi:hypothetical protein